MLFYMLFKTLLGILSKSFVCNDLIADSESVEYKHEVPYSTSSGDFAPPHPQVLRWLDPPGTSLSLHKHWFRFRKEWQASSISRHRKLYLYTYIYTDFPFAQKYHWPSKILVTLKMASNLIDIKNFPTKLFINNEWTDSKSSERLRLENPKDHSLITSDVHSASAEDVDIAVAYSKDAFETGPWSKFTGEQRSKCLLKLADLIDAHTEQLAYLESVCSGRLLSMCLRELPRASATYRCGLLHS